MPRIAGTDLPEGRPVHFALTAIYGIGRNNVQSLLKKAKVDFKLHQYRDRFFIEVNHYEDISRSDTTRTVLVVFKVKTKKVDFLSLLN